MVVKKLTGPRLTSREGRRRGVRPWLSLWAVAPLLFGCTVVGPDFETPDAPESPAWQETEGDGGALAEQAGVTSGKASVTLDQAQPVPDDWWKVFNDPALDRLIGQAQRQNLTLHAAGVRILEARAQLGIAVGEQYPQTQQATAGFERRRISENVGVLRDITRVIDIDRTFNDYSVGLDAGWELDLWGRFRRGIEAADANFVAQIANYDDILVALAGEVAVSYTAIRTYQELLFLTKQNIDDQKEGLRLAQVKFKNGTTTELDVFEATALLHDTEATIPELVTGLRQAENALSILLGLPPGGLDDLLPAAGQIPAAPADVSIGVPAELLRRRPDIRAAELQAAAQSAQIGMAQADLYPAFTLSGAVGFSSSDLTDLFQGKSFTGGFNPSFTWNIFNYGQIRNNVRVQDARLQELILNYQNTVLTAYQEVENALVAFVQAQLQSEQLRKAVTASKNAVRIALVQYRQGTADYTRVLNTQSALLRGQARLAQSQGNEVSNLISAYKALGGGWQVRQDQDVVPPEIIQTMRDRTDWGGLLDDDEIPKDDRALNPPPSPEPVTLFRRPPDW